MNGKTQKVLEARTHMRADSWKTITCGRGHVYYAASPQLRCWVCHACIVGAKPMEVPT